MRYQYKEAILGALEEYYNDELEPGGFAEERGREIYAVYQKAEAFDSLKRRVDLWIKQLNEVRPTNEMHRAVVETQLKAAKDVRKAMQEAIRKYKEAYQ